MEYKKDQFLYKAGQLFFRWRGKSPLPLVLLVIFFARPDVFSLILGTLFAIGGETIRYWGMRHIGGSARTRNPERVDEFIVSGPYRYIRNPLYLGNFFTGLGVSLMSRRWEIVVLYVFLFFLQYIPIIHMEEVNLENKYGDTFVKYLNQVPRWFPRVPSPLAQVNRERIPHLLVLKNERSTILGIAVLVFYFTLLYGYRLNLF